MEFPMERELMGFTTQCVLQQRCDFVDGAMGAIGLGLIIASFGLPFEPEVNRVATQLKELSRFAFPSAIPLNRVDDFLA